jgi:4'-phosphopantetheinyl transferase
MRPVARGTDRPLRQDPAGARGSDALSAAWEQPPERPALGADETHVWAFEADSPAARDAGRRSILAAYVGLPPESLAFTRSQFGKPELATPGACPGLRMSCSASEGLVLVAVRRDHALGVDVEAERELPVGMAERAMTAAERSAFDALPPAARAPRFLALWVAKEAATKAAGLGLHQPFDAFDAAEVVRLPRDGGFDTYWVAALPAPRAGFAAAIASTAPIREPKLWLLPGPTVG